MFAFGSISSFVSAVYCVLAPFRPKTPASILNSLLSSILALLIRASWGRDGRNRGPVMSFGKRKGFSHCIRGVRARNVLDADAFAAAIGRPLNVAVDLNWSKMSVGDDVHGHHLAAWRKRASRFLRKHGVDRLTCTWARERPTIPVPRPNAHLNCYIPANVYDAFIKNAYTFLPPGCVTSEREAIYIQLIGSTGEDHRRRCEYLVKGAHLKARLKIQRKRNYQGRIFGKRCGTSEDIGLAARLRHAASRVESLRSIPF